MTEEKWTLSHGCYRGSAVNAEKPTKYDTEVEALRAWQEHRKFYIENEIFTWFAELTSPDGQTRTLESNLYY